MLISYVSFFAGSGIFCLSKEITMQYGLFCCQKIGHGFFKSSTHQILYAKLFQEINNEAGSSKMYR